MGMNELDIACKIRSEVENSLHDIAQSGAKLFKTPLEVDIEADRIWDNALELRDLIGDKIFWAANMMNTGEDRILCQKICICLIQISHPAMKEAVNRFMIDHNLI